MKRLLRYAGVVVGLILLTAAGGVGVAQFRWDRTFTAPASTLRATNDSLAIARGRYLAFGPAKCANCHSAKEAEVALRRGDEVPLSGGREFVLPVGTFRVPNLTPDVETGIGRRTDAELVRLIRHGVRHDGRAALPFMEFQNLADEDVVALLSYLRSRPPVRHAVADHDFTPVGRVLTAFVIKPKGPNGTPPQHAPSGSTIERGKYLVMNVAECASCHTQRSMLTGAYTAPLLSGGAKLPDDEDSTRVLVTPNLTPDARTGRIAQWSEDQFVGRFRSGRVLAGSHMPWEAFARMSDDDLRAIYRYLRTVPPVQNDPGPSSQPKDD